MHRFLIPSLVVAAALAGCATSTTLSPQGAVDGAGNSPVALPAGSTVRLQDSLMMGSGDAWVGRLVANVGSDAGAAYRYFLETYPQQGWTLLSTVRAKSSLLVFTRQDRTATIEIAEGGGVGGGNVATVTVTPKAAQPMVAAPQASGPGSQPMSGGTPPAGSASATPIAPRPSATVR